MALHKLLIKKFAWYRKWDNFRYAQVVHYSVFLILYGINLYLALELLRLNRMY